MLNSDNLLMLYHNYIIHACMSNRRSVVRDRLRACVCVCDGAHFFSRLPKRLATRHDSVCIACVDCGCVRHYLTGHFVCSACQMKYDRRPINLLPSKSQERSSTRIYCTSNALHGNVQVDAFAVKTGAACTQQRPHECHRAGHGDRVGLMGSRLRIVSRKSIRKHLRLHNHPALSESGRIFATMQDRELCTGWAKYKVPFKNAIK